MCCTTSVYPLLAVRVTTQTLLISYSVSMVLPPDSAVENQSKPKRTDRVQIAKTEEEPIQTGALFAH